MTLDRSCALGLVILLSGTVALMLVWPRGIGSQGVRAVPAPEAEREALRRATVARGQHGSDPGTSGASEADGQNASESGASSERTPAQALRELVLSSPVEGPAASELSADKRQLLADLCVDRYSVMVSPSFESAVDLFERQTGLPHPSRSKPEAEQESMRSFFRIASTPWAKGSLDPGKGRIVCRYLSGLLAKEPKGNSIYVSNAAGKYGPLKEPERQRFSVYDVYLPWSIAMRTKDGAIDRERPGWLIFSYAWNVTTGAWQPWRVTFNDPDSETEAMVILWM